MCSKHFLRKSVHMTTQLDPQVVSHCKQASYAECAGESHLQTKFCRLNTNTVKLNGPNIHNPWPSSMAAPLIFEKHSRRPHGSCVLWCCLRRTAPTRKTTWFAQGPRVVFNLAQGGFQSCPGRFSILPRVVFNQQCQGYILTIVKELPWRFGYHLRGFCFLRRPTQIKRIGLDILDSPEKKAGKRKTPLSHNQLVQNIHTPFYTQSEMKFDILIFRFETRQR